MPMRMRPAPLFSPTSITFPLRFTTFEPHVGVYPVKEIGSLTVDAWRNFKYFAVSFHPTS